MLSLSSMSTSTCASLILSTEALSHLVLSLVSLWGEQHKAKVLSCGVFPRDIHQHLRLCRLLLRQGWQYSEVPTHVLLTRSR